MISVTAGGAQQVVLWLATARGKVVLAALLVFGGFLCAMALLPDATSRSTATGITNVAMAIMAITASVAACRRQGLDPRAVRAWRLLSAAVISISAATATVFYYDSLPGARPAVSAADLFYALFYALFLAGLLTLSSTPRTPLARTKRVLDAATVMAAGGAVIWHVVFHPVVDHAQEAAAGVWLAFLWPVLDLALLFGVALVLLERGRSSRRLTMQLIGVAGLFMFAGDVLFAAHAVHGERVAMGDGASVLWLLSAVAWIAAAQAQPGGRSRSSTSGETDAALRVETVPEVETSALPYAAIAAVYMLFLVVERHHIDGIVLSIVLSTGLVTALVVARQYLTLRENGELLAERARLHKELAYDAQHDALTGLASRSHFLARLGRALAKATSHPDRVAVMLLDLDDFKDVNDTLGHEKGDLMLKHVAHRLLHATRGSDLVARLGGDEFAILVDRVTRDEDLVTVAQRAIDSISKPVKLDGAEALCGVSVGIARLQPGMGVADLLRNADIAMYDAKQRGKGEFTFFAGEMQDHVLDRARLEADLRHALERGEIGIAYQPIVRMVTGEVAGVEALVRWRHPVRGVLQPMQFVALAEEAGVMVELGRFVLDEACREGARWRAQDGTAHDFFVAVNISGRQIQHAGLGADIEAALRRNGLPPEALMLDVTEGAVARDVQLAAQRLGTIRARGVRLALDDFGTGYSSMAFLKRFPVDVIKMDGSFTADLGVSDAGAAFARAIVAIADALGVPTWGEGVESAEVAEMLISLGCTAGQGFHFAHPLAVQQVDALLAEQERAMETAGQE